MYIQNMCIHVCNMFTFHIHAYIHAHMHAYMHTYVDTCSHMYIYIYVCLFNAVCFSWLFVVGWCGVAAVARGFPSRS